MPTTVYFTLCFPTAFRLESGSIVKSIQIESVGFGMIPEIAFTDFFSQAQLSRETRRTYYTYARRTPAPKTFRAWSSL
jgi:hypothetical protein